MRARDKRSKIFLYGRGYRSHAIATWSILMFSLPSLRAVADILGPPGQHITSSTSKTWLNMADSSAMRYHQGRQHLPTKTKKMKIITIVVVLDNRPRQPFNNTLNVEGIIGIGLKRGLHGCQSGYDACLTNQTSLVRFPSPLNFS